MSEDLQRRLRDLIVHPNEDLGVEIKNWLDLEDKDHRARVAKEAMALANFGGGYIVFGFNDKGVPRQPATPRPADLDDYNQDEINACVRRYADPAFHCSVHYVEHPDTREYFPVVVVPGDHIAPIKAKRHSPDCKLIQQGEVYIRKPGPTSEPASSQDIELIWARCYRVGRARHGLPLDSGVTDLDAVAEAYPFDSDHDSGTAEDSLLGTLGDPADARELRHVLTDSQRRLLSAIWNYYTARNQWIPCRVLHHKFYGQIEKVRIQSEFAQLGKEVVVPSWDDGEDRYRLSFLGILLADEGLEVESLVVRFLAHLKAQFLANPEVKSIPAEDVKKALGLTAEDTRALGRLLYLSPFCSGSFGPDEWSAGVPRDVDDLAEAQDLSSFTWERAVRSTGWQRPAPVWQGIEWHDAFIAYAGPLAPLRELDPEINDPKMIETLEAAGYECECVSQPQRVSQRKAEGYRFAYETDKTTWKRKLKSGELSDLMIRRGA